MLTHKSVGVFYLQWYAKGEMIKFLRTISPQKIRGKICLLRADLNIKEGMEKNAFRLQTIIPTIQFLLKNKCKIIIISHRGQPKKSDVQNIDAMSRTSDFSKLNASFSTKPFAQIIAKQIKKPVKFLPNFNLKRYDLLRLKNDVVLLENLRFLRGEEKNDEKFAKQLASLADFYVNEAFSVCHRKHASIVAITKFLPSYAGLRLEEEIKQLDKVMLKPARQFTVIIGGAKIADKLGIVKNFWSRADYFLFGGGPANTLLAARGINVGNSLVDQTTGGRISQILKFVHVGNPTSKILLPIDFKKSGNKILDIGPKTIKKYEKIIRQSKTIIWNGPVGLFEKKKFSAGTKEIWKAVLANRKARVVVGGGETIASFKLLNSKFYIPNSHVFISTGGGAMLEYLSGKKLPGIEVLKR